MPPDRIINKAIATIVHQATRATGNMGIWLVYYNTRDYPNKYIARLQRATNRGGEFSGDVLIADSLELLRQQLPDGLYRLPRSEFDDKVIVETWL